MERKSHLRFLALTGAVLLTASVARPVRAQDDPDDLKRGVARISVMNGEVSVRRGDSGEWVAGVINAPLLTDDRVATGTNSRAEVQFDASNILRIGGNAEVRLAQVESGTYRLELARGTVTYRVLRASSANVELNTPSVSVRPSKEGTYRITVNDAGESEITARAGDVEVFTPRGSQWVYAGQTMLARGSTADPEFQMASAVPYDDWDRWNESRDHALLQSTSSQYVPQGVYGAEDLDNAGSWVDVPSYGNVWRPTVVVGWSPYRYGRWVWEPWYGWTWVSDDWWGWAPYHYGRWFWDTGFGWCWYPGAFGMRHYWSPALVGFFGFGRGGGFGFGFGHIGWVPLAPHEPFHRWWGRGAQRFNQNMNIADGNIRNIYRNARVTNGIATVSAEDFHSGRFNNIQRVSGQQMGQVGLVHGQMPLPGSANRRFSDRQVSNVPRTNENLSFYSRQQGRIGGPGGQGTGAPNAVRSPGAAQTPQSGFRRFGEPGASNNLPRGNSGASVPAPRAPQAGGGNQTPGGRSEGIRRFGEPGANQPAPRTNDRPPAGQRNGGWNSFGTPGSTGAPPRAPYNPPPQRTNPGAGQGTGRSYAPAPSYSAPRQAPAPSYSAPRQAPSYSAPRPAPSYSAPRPAPAPSYSAPRSSPPSGGGGGGRSSGGGGGHSSSGSHGGGRR